MTLRRLLGDSSTTYHMLGIFCLVSELIIALALSNFMERKTKKIAVVVVEDEPLVRLMAVDSLVEAGFCVEEAGNADEAIKLLEQKATELHVLFTDVHMPGSMTGVALAHHTARQWPWIAIIIASGQARPHSDELPAGSRFFSKPYNSDHVVSHIMQVV